MNISILTLFPELYQAFLDTSLLKKAQEHNKLSFSLKSLFAYAQPKERIDDTTFGHNAGMLIRPDILEKAIDDVDGTWGKSFKIFLSPQGKKFDQKCAKKLWETIQHKEHVLFFASRYEGIDARVEQYYADEVLSVGDFVTMGGDIPAMLVLESMLRYMPGIVGKQESVERDSFSGPFVDYPEYTKPVVWKGLEVPEVLRSGNHAKIDAWRQEQAVSKTVLSHFSWLRSQEMTTDQKKIVKRYIPSHYVALMHSGILLKEGRVGNTSVTSIDIHDIARSSATYGMKNFFIVTPLKDQQKIVQTMLDFWHDKSIGGEYNKNRHEALCLVALKASLEDVIVAIEQKEGKKPIIIGTSARFESRDRLLTYYQQDVAWSHQRPILFLFGTGNGMSEELLQLCDYMLHPIEGFERFNHLSVRSAVAIIFDKWLGIGPK